MRVDYEYPPEFYGKFAPLLPTLPDQMAGLKTFTNFMGNNFTPAIVNIMKSGLNQNQIVS